MPDFDAINSIINTGANTFTAEELGHVAEKWHVQGDTEVWSESNGYICDAGTPAMANFIADQHNAILGMPQLRRDQWWMQELHKHFATGHVSHETRRAALVVYRHHRGEIPEGEWDDLIGAFDCLTSWLLDNTEEVFEEEPEIDEARGIIADIIERENP